MYEAVLGVLVANARWLCQATYIAPTGYPLVFGVLVSAWCAGCLPKESFSFETTLAKFGLDLALLVVATDIAQTFLHRLVHTSLRHTLVGRSHAIHHLHTDPRPEDAFCTGVADALYQLIGPLFVVMYAVRPSRGALGAFGCVYSCWLNFIHSNPNCEYPLLRRLGFVTPEYHHAHHREPKTHFSNVLRWI